MIQGHVKVRQAGVVVQAAQIAAASDNNHLVLLTLVVPDGRVIVGNGRFHNATVISSDVLIRATPITIGGKIVGLLVSDNCVAAKIGVVE